MGFSSRIEQLDKDFNAAVRVNDLDQMRSLLSQVEDLWSDSLPHHERECLATTAFGLSVRLDVWQPTLQMFQECVESPEFKDSPIYAQHHFLILYSVGLGRSGEMERGRAVLQSVLDSSPDKSISPLAYRALREIYGDDATK